jgi:hypothetical protein
LQPLARLKSGAAEESGSQHASQRVTARRPSNLRLAGSTLTLRRNRTKKRGSRATLLIRILYLASILFRTPHGDRRMAIANVKVKHTSSRSAHDGLSSTDCTDCSLALTVLTVVCTVLYSCLPVNSTPNPYTIQPRSHVVRF